MGFSSTGAARIAGAAVIAWAALGAIGLRTTVASDGVTQRYRDPTYKFSLLYPDEFDPIPVESGDIDTCCRFAQRGADVKGVAAARLTIFRSGPAPAQTKPGDAQKDADPSEPSTPTDLVDLFNEMLTDNGYTKRVEKSVAKPVKSRDGVPGRLWAMDLQVEEFSVFHFFVVWNRPGDPTQIGLWGRCATAQRKRNETMFRAVAQSFQWFDEKAKEATTLDVLKDVRISPGKRREIERGLVKGWNVIVSPKKNYVVIYNTKGKRNDLLAKMLAERIEQIREQLYEPQFPPARPIETVSVMRVCGDRSEYRAYGGPGGTAGYWSPDAEELVFYDASPAKKLDEDTLAVCYHEAFHQYIHYSTGEVAPHSWFDEGHGDYYAGAKNSGGKFRIAPFVWRLGTIKAAIRAGPSPKKEDGTFDRTKKGYTPLVDLVRFSQDEYYDYAHVCYAQGWSLVYFLREIVPKNPEMKAKWGGILDKYFSTLRGTLPPPAPPPAAAPAGAPAAPPAGRPAPPPKPKPEPEPEPEPAPPIGAPTDDGESPTLGPKPPEVDDTQPSETNTGVAPPRRVSGGGDIGKALEDALKGVNLVELEQAWKAAILAIPG